MTFGMKRHRRTRCGSLARISANLLLHPQEWRRDPGRSLGIGEATAVMMVLDQIAGIHISFGRLQLLSNQRDSHSLGGEAESIAHR